MSTTEERAVEPPEFYVLPGPVMAPFGARLALQGAVQDVWDAYIAPGQKAQMPQSVEERELMALLRSLNAAATSTGPAEGMVAVPLEALRALVGKADQWREQADADYVSSKAEQEASDREFTDVVAALGVKELED